MAAASVEALSAGRRTLQTDKVPFRSRMEADEHKKWFKEPPPPSLKSSRGRSRGGGQTPRIGRGPKKGSFGGFYVVCTVRRDRS
ncbi:Serine/Threonine-Protein Phosphatase 2A 55 Kda Regulatory Subunit B Delta Isoform [Manis pentadactyla]|nr:Serine/Threonine-Protein Phosphatase 2A 55 Kda Regulatory Subunit B Delta Isoform [Manis pentadactyla]